MEEPSSPRGWETVTWAPAGEEGLLTQHILMGSPIAALWAVGVSVHVCLWGCGEAGGPGPRSPYSAPCAHQPKLCPSDHRVTEG